MALKIEIPHLGRKLFRLTILGYFGAALLILAVAGFNWRINGNRPPQPIEFPHTVHAGQLGLTCDFCHIHVRESRHAGVPPLEKCMSCHRSVATDRPEVQKLRQHFEEKRPVEWNRVHDLPDFIYFTHKRHVKAGIDCFECHGAMQLVTTGRRVRPLKMGWCVGCHKHLGGPTDCATCHH